MPSKTPPLILPQGIVPVVGGQAQTEPRIVRIDQFEELAASLIEYFDHPRFPNAQVTGLVSAEGTQVESAAGATEHVITIKFFGERRVEWFTKIGILAKILAENVNGKFPEKSPSA